MSILGNAYLLKQNNVNCSDKGIGGIKRLFYTDRTALGNFGYTETNAIQFGEIINCENPQYWWLIDFSLSTAEFTETPKLEPSRYYGQTLSFDIKQMTIESRDFLENLYTNDNIAIVFQDYNNQYFLMGEENGCRFIQSFKTGQFKSNQTYNCSFIGFERYPVRTVNSTFVNTFVVYYKNISQYYTIAELDALTIQELNYIKPE